MVCVIIARVPYGLSIGPRMTQEIVDLGSYSYPHGYFAAERLCDYNYSRYFVYSEMMPRV